MGPGASLAGVVLGFWLARVQGRSQTRYIKSAEYITKLRELLLECRWTFEVLPEYENESSDEIAGTSAILADRVIEMLTYYETYKPWFPHHTIDRLEPGLFLEVLDMGLPLIREEEEKPVSREEFNELLDQLKNTDLAALARELDEEVEYLLGTLPWRQRFSIWRRRFFGFE